MDAGKPLLSIIIPTYNRASKLARLLLLLRNQIAALSVKDQVEIVIGDNCSLDETPAMVSSALSMGGQIQIDAVRHEENIGMDRNVRFLYERAKGDYVWLLADDDLIFDQALARILDALEKEQPDILLFSFVQPPDSPDKTFDFPTSPARFTEPVRIIELLTKYPKISIFVVKRVEYTEQDRQELSRFEQSNWGFVCLAFAALEKSKSPSLCIISEALAGCDSEFNQVRMDAGTWGRFWTVFTHSYPARVVPGYAEQHKSLARKDQLVALWAWRAGTLQVSLSEQPSYWKAIAELPLYWKGLSRNMLAKLILLKLSPRFAPRLVNRAAGAFRKLHR